MIRLKNLTKPPKWFPTNLLKHLKSQNHQKTPKKSKIYILRAHFRSTQRLATTGAHGPYYSKQPGAEKSKNFRPEVQIKRQLLDFSPKRVLRIHHNIVCRIIPERDKLRENGWYRRMPSKNLHPNTSTNSPSSTPPPRHFRSERRRLKFRLPLKLKDPRAMDAASAEITGIRGTSVEAPSAP